MHLSVRSTGPCQHALDIEVPADEVEERLDEVARQVQRRAQLPGFRRGRVPLDLVRSHFAEAVEQQLLEDLIPRVTQEAIAEAKLDPVVPAQVRNLRFTPGQPLRFEATIDVRPEVEARDYKGLPARRRVRHIDEQAVERVLARLCEEAAIYVDLDRPAERGDSLLVDSVRVDPNGRRLPSTRAKGRRIELGAPGVPPDLENGLLGATAGMERTVDVAYPADYPIEELAGTRARYAIRVRKNQEKKLRQLDDNFAREVFHLDTLEELRSRIRLNLETEERVRIQRELEGAVSEELLKRNPVTLPERWVSWMLDRVIEEAVQGPIDPAARERIEQQYRPGVERSLRRDVLLAAVARQEHLEVGEGEVAEEIERMTQADPRQAARIRARYQTTERRQALRESLLERKALEWMIQQADVQEETEAERPLVVPAAR